MTPISAPELEQAGEALAIRWRNIPARIIIGGASAAVSGPLLGWATSGAWLGVMLLALVIECAVAAPVVRGGKPITEARLKVAVLAMGFAAASFGSLCLLYSRLPDSAGGEVAALIIAGALLNALSICQASRRLFMALALPALFFLALQPVLMLLTRGDYALSGPLLVCAGSVSATVMLLARAIENTRQREAAARAELSQALATSEEHIAAKSQFVAMVGHELRTPISGVLAAAGELERHADPQVRDHARMIAEGGRMMRAVLNDLLDLAKIEAGRMSVERTVFDVRDLVEQTVRFWSTEAKAKGLDLAVRGAERLPRAIEGDPTRVRQILNNLLSNAVKFTSTGAISVMVQISDDANDRPVIRLSVADSGPGLSPERLARLFTPFTQADDTVTRLHGGTGLGLAISRHLARIMDGDLSADSRQGAGCTFTLKLPLMLATAPAAEPRPTVAPATPTLATGSPRLLIADDHPINRRALRLLLGPLGPRVTEAENGEQALAALAAEPFELVLLDLNMPDLSGLEVARRLRAVAGPNRGTPVLAVTADTEPEVVGACLAAGMTGFVAKPIEAAELLTAVTSALASAQLEGVESHETAAEPLPQAAA